MSFNYDENFFDALDELDKLANISEFPVFHKIYEIII